jgi:hypothetical protein
MNGYQSHYSNENGNSFFVLKFTLCKIFVFELTGKLAYNFNLAEIILSHGHKTDVHFLLKCQTFVIFEKMSVNPYDVYTPVPVKHKKLC